MPSASVVQTFGADCSAVSRRLATSGLDGLSLFAHAFELGLLLLRHELTAFLVPLRERLLFHRLGRELRSLLHGALASVVTDRFVGGHDVLLSRVVAGCL